MAKSQESPGILDVAGPAPPLRCPACLPENSPPPGRCPQCGRNVAASQFSLSALMLLTALAAAWLAMTIAYPCGGPFTLMVLPFALYRTNMASHFAQSCGRPLRAGEAVGAFFASLGIVLLILLAPLGVLALVLTTCVLAFDLLNPFRARAFFGPSLCISVLLGLPAAVPFFGYLARWLWPVKNSGPTALELWRKREDQRRESG